MIQDLVWQFMAKICIKEIHDGKGLPHKTSQLNIMVMLKSVLRVNIMYSFNRVPPNRFALLAAFLGTLLNFALNSEEKAALGNFIVSIGQTMLTAQAQEENQKSIREREDLRKEVRELNSRIEDINKKLR